MSEHSSPLRSAFADDAEFAELIHLFVEELPERIATIDQAVASRDLSRLLVVAHQLKGAGGGYGFSEITDASRTLEQLAQKTDLTLEDDLDRLSAAANEVIDLCQRATAD
ncbi:MAG: Hpt domain-containing protein [Planctomycetota bacterium]